jgi:hypothetical protein
VGVRVPPGALHARLAQWESARFTPARRTGSIPSPSTVAVAQSGRAPGCDPGGCAFEPRRSPPRQGRARGSAASRKAAGRPAIGGSSPSPGTRVPRPPPPATACPRGAAGKRGCFRNSRSPVRVGPGIPWRTSRRCGRRSPEPPVRVRLAPGRLQHGPRGAHAMGAASPPCLAAGRGERDRRRTRLDGLIGRLVSPITQKRCRSGARAGQVQRNRYAIPAGRRAAGRK